MSRPSRIGAVNQQFLDRIRPEFNSWGLVEHPNPVSYFGRGEHGYRYDFADTRNASDIKIAAFAIFRSDTSLWIKGFRTAQSGNVNDIPIIFDSIAGVFTLTKNWSILTPINIRFEFKIRKNDKSNDAAAERLIDDVVKALPKLKNYLYG